MNHLHSFGFSATIDGTCVWLEGKAEVNWPRGQSPVIEAVEMTDCENMEESWQSKFDDEIKMAIADYLIDQCAASKSWHESQEYDYKRENPEG